MHTSLYLYKRFMKVNIVPLEKELVQVPVSMFWFGTSSENIIKIIKSSNLIFIHLMMRVIIYLDDLFILGTSMNEICMAKVSVIFLLQHLGFPVNLKKYVLDYAEEAEFLGLIVNFQTMTLSLPAETIEKKSDQCQRLYKAEVSLLDFKKLIGTLSSTIQGVFPVRQQFCYLQQQEIVSLIQTPSYLTFEKLTPIPKNEFLWWVINVGLCWDECLRNHWLRSLFRQMHLTKAGEQYINGSEQEASSPRRNRIYI